MLELTDRKASAKILKYHISAKSLHRCSYKMCFPACFLLEERLRSYRSKFFPLESRFFFLLEQTQSKKGFFPGKQTGSYKSCSTL